jgi:hypothetical protein
MSRDANILEALFKITRGDLEAAVFPQPDFASPDLQFSFLKLARISSFWKQRESTQQTSLQECVEDFVAGLFSQRVSWAYLVDADPEAIKIGYGVTAKESLETLRASLLGAFPDSRISTTSFSRSSELAKLKHAARVAGCPTSKTDPIHGLATDQIERVCRGLVGCRWAYVVVASPVDPPRTVRAINELTKEIRRVRETELSKSGGPDEQNRPARQYSEFLEHKLGRLQKARTRGAWETATYLLADDLEVIDRASALLQAAFSGERSIPDAFRVRPCSVAALAVPPPESLNSGELAVLTSPPREEFAGYQVSEYVRFGVDIGLKTPTPKVALGPVFDRGQRTPNHFELALADLSKHTLIVGMTGSGKTNTCFNLLDQVWAEGGGVPFLVIESAKSEYRALITDPRFKGLRVFTLGDETVSPFRINPFEVPKEVLVQRHIDCLKALFAAAFVLYPPMPYVLEQSIQEIYEDRGWELASNANDRGDVSTRLFPTLSDLHSKVGTVIDRMGYAEEITMNVRSGLQARINQLRIGGGKGLMLNTHNSIPVEDLFHSPCLLELKQVVSDDEKAFLMGLILIRLYEHHDSGCMPGGPGLKHLTLIEEAHRLLRNTSTDKGSEVFANPRGHSIEVFTNILSEIRAFGEGIVISEQIPSKLTLDAIKNTNLKIVHRLLPEDDRRLMAGAMGLQEAQTRHLSTLAPGEAVALAENVSKAALIMVPLSAAKKAGTSVTDYALQKHMIPYWKGQPTMRLRFVGCTRCVTAGRAPTCSAADRILATWSVQRVLAQCFAAMMHNVSYADKAFTDFVVVLRKFWQPTRPVSPYCVMMTYAEQELDGLGAFYGWKYADVDKAVELASAVTWQLAEGQDTTAALRDFSELVRRLCERDIGPLPGCESCEMKCSFQYEAQRLARLMPQHGVDFRSAYLDPQNQVEDVARLAWTATADCIWEEDNVTRASSALCFAVQQFDLLGLPTYAQQSAAKMTLRGLQSIGGLGNG